VTKEGEKAFSQHIEENLLKRRLVRSGEHIPFVGNPSSVARSVRFHPRVVCQTGGQCGNRTPPGGAGGACGGSEPGVRARMGTFEAINVLAVLIGSAVSGMPTVKRFVERTNPFGEAFLRLFGRQTLPSPAALSRFLALCTQFERVSFG
jgi:hypothetical protein